MWSKTKPGVVSQIRLVKKCMYPVKVKKKKKKKDGSTLGVALPPTHNETLETLCRLVHSSRV